MNKSIRPTPRRTFLKASAMATAGLTTGSIIPLINEDQEKTDEGLYMIGPKKGYAPVIGTLLSTMTMMREWVLNTVRDLSVEQLDFLVDDQANSIGSMLWHLAATERYYQLNTFEEMEWGSWSQKIKDEWDLPMNLGDEARKKIKGHDIDFYMNKLDEVRDVTQREFARRDDDWLQVSEPFFGNQPTNNHCKWFHVCEHESNHNGQMKFIVKRLPA
ncbi:MAG: DUF664 domain-containing protein [Saprospiraceae bacterium]|nr:DUF664 domain-containing protein [Saprospiraceae bacterium]